MVARHLEGSVGWREEAERGSVEGSMRRKWVSSMRSNSPALFRWVVWQVISECSI